MSDTKKCPHCGSQMTRGRDVPDAVLLMAQEAVAGTFGVKPGQVFGRERTQKFVRPRFVAYRLLSDAGYALARIGEASRRDHTTVISGLRRFDVLAGDPDFSALAALAQQKFSKSLAEWREAQPQFIYQEDV